MKLLVINGVNLNLTGRREQGVYGAESLDSINAYLAEYGKARGVQIDFYQSNIEGEICTALHNADGMYEGVVLNAGAFTHYSYAIRDAIAAVGVPVVEVHTQVCKGEILGFGKNSYRLALESFLI